ncbi:MAG: hydrogenase maturation nickel metallochaperone HypA [Deltaproteobacteria bacterium]|nr:MAG: hydrogenase maturation nickel metallochaperone HypA [Deltaproteobacteria bacterium]HDG98853.1 hydrogenase maturation nickel metallochaperone HypA [Desulfobacterales bacterium]
MHEMSIAQSLLDIIKEEMAKNDAKVLRTVRLHIGQLTAIVPESLSFCFEVMTAGTELEGAKLIMEIIPLVGHCQSCDRDFQIENYAFACPYCQSTDIKTVSGEELSIVEMEVE